MGVGGGVPAEDFFSPFITVLRLEGKHNIVTIHYSSSSVRMPLLVSYCAKIGEWGSVGSLWRSRFQSKRYRQDHGSSDAWGRALSRM